MKTLSIIIPTYNMEDYLPRCLDSLLAEGVLDQLEVWIVNDGSRDRSSEIAHQYESRYPGVFNVIDKENGNYGSCINVALPLCTGKYVKILDADDWFETANLSRFIVDLQETDVDLVLTDVVQVRNGNRIAFSKVQLQPKLIVPEFSVDQQALFAHIIAYRTSYIHSLDYHQTEGISYTDNEWGFYPFFHVKTIVYFNYILYNYFIGREEQTVNFNNHVANIQQEYLITVRMLKLYIAFDKSSLHENRKKQLCLKMLSVIESCYKIYLLSKPITEVTIDLLSALDLLIKEAGIEKYVNDLRVTVFGFQVKYVKIYRCYGLHAFKLFLKVYNLRSRLKR